MKRSGETSESTGFPCPLCGRECGQEKRSKHHLVPKCRDGKVTVDICADCHRQIHALFTEREIERYYDTLDKLRASAPMQRWIAWVSKQNAGAHVRVRTCKSKHGQNSLKDIFYGAV